jgi:hypothetical protein
MWKDFLILFGILPAGKPITQKRLFSRTGYPTHFLYLKSEKDHSADKKAADLMRSKY